MFLDKPTSGRKLYDDSSLTFGWYKFDVPGSTNSLPTFTPGFTFISDNTHSILVYFS